MRLERGGAYVPDDVLLPEHLSRYRWVAPRLKSLQVLDVGCGYGYGSDLIAAHGAERVVGLDTDPQAVAFSARRFRRPGLSYTRSQTRAIRDGVADAVVSFEVLEHVHDADRLVAELARLLRPGGTLFLSTPNRTFTERFYVDGHSTNPFHIREYSVPEVNALLHRSFAEVHCFQQGSPRSYWEYSDHCAIPPRFRKLVPQSIRAAWLRFRGVGKHEPVEAFRFDPVADPALFPTDRETQVYECRR